MIIRHKQVTKKIIIVIQWLTMILLINDSGDLHFAL